MTEKNRNIAEDEFIEIYGARENNLKNIDLRIPRDKLVVITGLSGSGKSSLAFETIYAEGQRRYMESFSAYARQFIGSMERPDVDEIRGLSPVISIEQKSVNRNPRSTVGTITEIYDFMRLLYARAAIPYSYNTGEKMVRYSEEQITQMIMEQYKDKRINVLAPVVRGRKGHYRDLFEQIRQQGYIKVRVDGEIKELVFGMQLDRYKTHDIEIVIDRLVVHEDFKERIVKSVETAFRKGKGMLMVAEEGSTDVRYFSKLLMCPTTGIAYQDPEPNTFSFNSPYGACPKCNGLGTIIQVDMKKIIPDPSLSLRKGGLAPLGEYKNNWVFNQLEVIGARYGFTLDTPISEIPERKLPKNEAFANYTRKIVGEKHTLFKKYVIIPATSCPSCVPAYAQLLKKNRSAFAKNKTAVIFINNNPSQIDEFFESIEENRDANELRLNKIPVYLDTTNEYRYYFNEWINLRCIELDSDTGTIIFDKIVNPSNIMDLDKFLTNED